MPEESFQEMKFPPFMTQLPADRKVMKNLVCGQYVGTINGVVVITNRDRFTIRKFLLEQP